MAQKRAKPVDTGPPRPNSRNEGGYSPVTAVILSKSDDGGKAPGYRQAGR